MLSGKTTFSYSHRCVLYYYREATEISLSFVRQEKKLFPVQTGSIYPAFCYFPSAQTSCQSGYLKKDLPVMLLRAPDWLHTEQLKASLASCSSSNVVMRNVLNFCKLEQQHFRKFKMHILCKALIWLHRFYRVSNLTLFMEEECKITL